MEFDATAAKAELLYHWDELSDTDCADLLAFARGLAAKSEAAK